MNTESNSAVVNKVAEEYHSAISQMIYGNWISQVTNVFAELNVADLLSQGPKNTTFLAHQAKVKEEYLKGFLRCALELDLVTFDRADGCYSVTAMGAILGAGHPQSKREEARLNGATYRYHPWGYLADILRNGMQEEFSPTLKHGSLTFLEERPEERETFHKAMTERSLAENELVLEGADFSGFERVLDIGAGRGTFIKAILTQYPDLMGYMFDLRETFVDGVEELYEARLSQKSGNFFEHVPDCADLYTMKSVIHNWPEDKAILLLRRVREAMASKTGIATPVGEKRLVIIENLLPENDEKGIANWMNLNFMITIGGVERTLEDYRILGEKAGLKLQEATPTPSGRYLIWFSVL